MHKFSLFIFLLICFVSCMNNSDRNKPSESTKPETSTANTVNGQTIFKISCAICHGNDGKLGANGSKDITKSILTLDERITLITKGKNTMPAQEGILSAEEIKAVAEYSLSLK